MNSTRFNELLDRYLAGIATATERDELMMMIHEGTYDETVNRSVETMLRQSSVGYDHNMDSESARKILNEIVRPDREQSGTVPLMPWRWYAAAAVLLAVIAAGIWRYTQWQVPVKTIVSVEEKAERAVFTGKQFVRLPDGSTALLNEGSRLAYVPAFGERDREVVLEGEAYFDVKHDGGKPFRVVTGKITTTVLGTSFNVSAYPENKEVKVTVTRGKVQVNKEEDMLGIITPDQQIAVNTETYDFVQRNVKAETATAWQSQYLILDDVSLEDATKVIGRKYNVEITLSNENLKACRISATFLKGESLEQVLTVVSGVVQATYTIDEHGNATIDGKGCI